LKSKSQIVSLQQDINKKDTYVDDGWTGERKTQLTVHGTYHMGLNTKDIEIKHIDSQNGIVYIKLPKPILINLDLPYDQIHFEKKQGFLRLAMDEKEEKTFYKAVEKNIERELMKDKELMKVADLNNKDVVMGLLKMLPEIKSVIFE
jgi:CYTH domain-containing protein